MSLVPGSQGTEGGGEAGRQGTPGRAGQRPLPQGVPWQEEAVAAGRWAEAWRSHVLAGTREPPAGPATALGPAEGLLGAGLRAPSLPLPLAPRVARNKQPAAVLVCKACASMFPLLMCVNSQASASWPPGWTKPGGLSQNTVRTSERRSKMEMGFELLTIF